MASRALSSGRKQILIAGGGFAAVEAALALAAMAEDRIALAMLAPDPVFHYRPAATTETFDLVPSRRYDLRAIARDVGASYHQSRLEAVASRKHSVRTSAGARLGYDTLIVATGARAVVGVPGAITFRDQRDIGLIRRVLGEVESGAVTRIAFTLPGGSVWPLPLYELALLSVRQARERGKAIESTLVTPESQPLALFGRKASDLVRGLLDERGVRFVGGAIPTAVRRDGSLELANGELVQADRVVALPELRARRLTGLPVGRSGFLPVDGSGRVEGLCDVYAAGDVTASPIKQGGIAAHQADVVAQTIAAGMGLPVKAVRSAVVLQARLLGGERPMFLRTELDWTARPTRASLIRGDDEQAAKAAKVLGRYLGPYLDTIKPLTNQRHPGKPTARLHIRRSEPRDLADGRVASEK
jgi:sulfide:quinone oxidoreductase